MRRAGARGFAERFYFDAGGNLLSSIREDRTLAITLHRDATGAVHRYEVDTGEPARAITGSFRFGPHGEVIAARLSSPDRALDVFAELRWTGTFAPTPGIARPFARYGGAAGAEHSGHAIQLLSANLAVRHASNPMAPLRFTGTVVVSYPGDARVDRYDYRDGRLERYRDHAGADTRYTWDARDRLLEETACTPADQLVDEPAGCQHFTSEYDGDRLVRTTGAGLDLRYDELERLVAGSYRGAGDEVTWSTCK